MWHLLDVGSIWMKEFAAALGGMTEVKCWAPEIRNFGWWETWQREVRLDNPRLDYAVFPLQRGYARFPIDQLMPMGSRVTGRLLRCTKDLTSVLVCTTPFYAPVAERWPGRVVYYLTDRTAEYPGMNRAAIRTLDRRMCCVADLVCPNSRRTAEYLRNEAGCDPEKLLVIPNATRGANLLSKPAEIAGVLPADLADLPRPVIGVMGNLAANMDWHLLRDAVARTPELSWAFVGPTSEKIADSELSNARRALMAQGGRVRFTGPKTYGALCEYSRAFDAAVLPYTRKEPTFSGSATRFYEHTAACRPIFSTRGVDELLDQEPLLTLIDTGAELAGQLQRLKANHFRDGYEATRWQASRGHTWETRAHAMMRAIEQNRPAMAEDTATAAQVGTA